MADSNIPVGVLSDNSWSPPQASSVPASVAAPSAPVDPSTGMMNQTPSSAPTVTADTSTQGGITPSTVDVHGGSDNTTPTQWQPSGNSFLTSGRLGKVESGLVNTLGQDQTPSYSVNDTGQLVASMNNATPGSMFKNLLVGALTGMSSAAKAGPRGGFLGAMGNGFTGTMQATNEQNQQNRANAVQQFQTQAQAQKNLQATTAADDTHAHMAASTAYQNALTLAMNAQNNKLPQEQQDAIYADNQKFLKNTGVTIHDSVPADQIQPILDADKTAGHTLIWKPVGEAPVMDPTTGKQAVGSDGKPQTQQLWSAVQAPQDTTTTVTQSMIDNWKKNNVANLSPEVGKIQPGQEMPTAYVTKYNADAQMQQHNDLQTQLQQADIKAKKAQAGEASAHTNMLTLSYKDATQAKTDQQNYGAALQEAGNDVGKASQIMQQKFPDSYQRLNAAEQIAASHGGTTETETGPGGDTTKTTVPNQTRLFSASPQGAPPQGVSTQQASAILQQAKNDIARGKSRDQVQSGMQAALGGKTSAMMNYLDSQGVFKGSKPGATPPATSGPPDLSTVPSNMAVVQGTNGSWQTIPAQGAQTAANNYGLKLVGVGQAAPDVGAP